MGSTNTQEKLPTESFGRYDLLFRFASGGMADVYAARMHGSAGFSRVVAIKRMQERFSDDSEFVGMFIDEGRIASHIHSPHVVSTLDLGRADDGSLFIAMELVVGASLWEVFRSCYRARQRLPLEAALEVIAQAASGLHAAHEATSSEGRPLQIIHRDVSPQNILIDLSGNVRLSDFGIAKAVERVTHTAVPEVKGKYGYCSPEQIDCAPLEQSSDIFSLGTVAWEVLTGKQLFTQAHPVKTMAKVLACEVPALSEFRTDIPTEIESLILRCLSRDPSKRPSSASEIATSIRHHAATAGLQLGGDNLTRLLNEHASESITKMQDRLSTALAGEESDRQLKSTLLSQPKSGISLRTSATLRDPHGNSSPETAPENTSRLKLTISLLVIIIGAIIGASLATWEAPEVPDAQSVQGDRVSAPPSTVVLTQDEEALPTPLEPSAAPARPPASEQNTQPQNEDRTETPSRPRRAAPSEVIRPEPRSTSPVERRRRAIRRRVDIPDEFPR